MALLQDWREYAYSEEMQNSKEGEKLALCMQAALVAGLDPANHRKAKGNKTYYMLKKTDAVLVICECGFLSNPEVFAMTAAAHDAGLSVMAHVNGAQAVMDAAEAGVDSVEHGNFQNEESICCMAEHATIWVPTIVTVSNLLENGRYPAETLAWIFETQKKGLQLAFEK